MQVNDPIVGMWYLTFSRQCLEVRTGKKSCTGVCLTRCVPPWSSAFLVVVEAGAIRSSECLQLADGNSQTYSVDGASTLTLTVVRGATLIIMPRR